MLLAIDTGNTNTLFAIHDGKDWIVEWRIATDPRRTADEYAVWFFQLMTMNRLKFSDITDCVISTVVPQSLFNMRNLARRHLNICLLYTSPSPRDRTRSRMPSSA